ncbi:metal-dependent hydrolase [Rubricoccus marinus]|uniref:Metal-dependent hydrolase n=1 Tax=Rubricoccus marinus TaxID=716817 RepID=A0A259U396_9BACT|nr:metal-dependent hydrolase [Rubricoccus marinus]OZC04298.1 metal-dependent hydrolase [Rubricoccus marinus]
MAGYKGHLTGAVVVTGLYLAGLAAVFAVDEAYRQFSEMEMVGWAAVLMGIGLMFGLWPDVDTNSKGQNIFYWLFFLTDVALIGGRHFREAAYLGLFCILPVIGKHRGWTHSKWAMLVVPAPLVLVPMLLFPDQEPLAGLPFYGAAVAGYFSHLLMDGLIVPLPWKKRRSGWSR